MPDTKTTPDNRYKEYLQKKHGGFNTDPKLLSEIVSMATESDVKDDQRIVEGEVNEVHRVTTDSGEKLIVRISRSSNPRFEAEKWAIDSARKVGVPAPEVLLVEKRTSENESLTFCVEKQIDGIPLRDYIEQVGTDSEDARHAVENAGVALAKIHSVEVGGYGNLSPEGEGHNTSWQEYMTSWSRKADKLIEPAKGIGLDPEVVEQAIKLIESHKVVYQISPPRLLHGDYGGDHVFIKDGAVSGIIDFESCKGGDPAWDFSWWSYFGKNRPPIKWLMNGYARETALDDDFELRVKLGELRLGLDMVHYYFYEKNEAGQDLAKRRLLEIVAGFK